MYAAAPRYVWATHLLEGSTWSSISSRPVRVQPIRSESALPRELLCAGSQLQPWCKDPLEDRLLEGCDLKTASRIAAVQIVAIEVPLTSLES